MFGDEPLHSHQSTSSVRHYAPHTYLQQEGERDVANIRIAVLKELAQDSRRFNQVCRRHCERESGSNALIQHRISSHRRGVCLRDHLLHDSNEKLRSSRHPSLSSSSHSKHSSCSIFTCTNGSGTDPTMQSAFPFPVITVRKRLTRLGTNLRNLDRYAGAS